MDMLWGKSPCLQCCTPSTLAAVCLMHLHHVLLALALLQQCSLTHRTLQHLLEVQVVQD